MPDQGGVTTSAPDTAGGGISPINLMFAAMMAKNPKQVTSLKAIYDLMKPPEETTAQETRRVAKTNADRIINLLEKNYYGGSPTPKLAYGRLHGIIQTINSKLGRNPDLNAYMALRDSVRPALVKAMGDVGNFSATEQQWAISNVPAGMNTPEEAQRYFRDLREKFALPENKKLVPDLPSSWQPEGGY